MLSRTALLYAASKLLFGRSEPRDVRKATTAGGARATRRGSSAWAVRSGFRRRHLVALLPHSAWFSSPSRATGIAPCCRRNGRSQHYARRARPLPHRAVDHQQPEIREPLDARRPRPRRRHRLRRRPHDAPRPRAARCAGDAPARRARPRARLRLHLDDAGRPRLRVPESRRKIPRSCSSSPTPCAGCPTSCAAPSPACSRRA